MFAEKADKLRQRGWRAIIPIKPNLKAPAIPGWQAYNIDPPSDPLITAWIAAYPGHGVGLCAGPDGVIGVDLDFIDAGPAAAAWDATTQIMGRTPLVRVGRAPKRMAFYRAPTDGVIAGRNFGRFEIYARSGQVVLYGLHEVTRRPYAWAGGAEPIDVAPADLPAATMAQIEALIHRLREVSEIDPARPPGRRSPSPAGSPFGATDRASGAVARVITRLREAPDPLAIAGEMIARAPEGDRHGAMIGVVTALAQLGYGDDQIDRACRSRYMDRFSGAAAREADFDRALVWARGRMGEDAATLAADPVFDAIQKRWSRA